MEVKEEVLEHVLLTPPRVKQQRGEAPFKSSLTPISEEECLSLSGLEEILDMTSSEGGPLIAS